VVSRLTLTSGFIGHITLGAEGAVSTVGTAGCPSGSEAATTSGCVTVDPLYDPTDFTPGGGDTGTVFDQSLIKPGTVSSTYYNHYSTLRTMEDLLLTGQTCNEPSNADTPLAAGTVCGGLDGKGHLGYAAQAGLATFGTDVFTAQSFTTLSSPPGFFPVGGNGSSPCTARRTSGSVEVDRTAKTDSVVMVAPAGLAAHPVVVRTAATAGWRRWRDSAGVGGNGGNGGNGACPPEEWSNGMWLSASGAATTPYDTPPCNGTWGDGGSGGNGVTAFIRRRDNPVATAATVRPANAGGRSQWRERLTRRALFGDRENTDNEKYARTGLRARPRAARRIDDVWRDVGGVRDGDVVSVVPAEKDVDA